MPDDSPEPTAEEFDRDWVMPVDLVQQLSALVNGGQTAVNEIMQRLIGGTLAAFAGSANYLHEGEAKNPVLVRVPANWWALADHIRVARADFWRTGTLNVDPPRMTSNARLLSDGRSTILFFDVRFDPAGIAAIPVIRAARSRPRGGVAEAAGAVRRLDHAILPRDSMPDETPAPSLPPIVRHQLAPELGSKPADDRKPVPEGWLKDWFAAYTLNLPVPVDTEDNAWASAKAFFPGHSVARDRIRALRKGMKTGRKPREAT